MPSYLLPALGGEAQFNCFAEGNVALEQCRCAIGAVGFEIGAVADAQIGGIEQQRERGKRHLLPVILLFDIGDGAAADGGQRLAEAFELEELRFAPERVPVGVIAILFSPACIKAGCLQMP
ncbi:hypothetical protein D3C86_1525570 [compost metagenome]